MIEKLSWKRMPRSLLALVAVALFAGADEPRPTPSRPPAPPIPAVAQALVDGFDPEVAKALEESWPDRPEWVDMLADILQGSSMGPNSGWFRTAVTQTRFDWASTRNRLDRDRDGLITRKEFKGPDADFARLDRDRDAVLTKADFDFSQQSLAPSLGLMLFSRADGDGNGKVTREEFDALFLSFDGGGQGFLSQNDLIDALALTPRGPARPGGSRPDAARVVGGGPSKATLVRGLFNQEIGSLQPGPKLDEVAPDFTLKTDDGKGEVTLSKLVSPKPVVLIFGNFTCGPFRSHAGNFDKLYQRYKDRATFVMVYVREAHPTDGWRMESNERVGVSTKQPRTYEERVEVAQACGRRLNLGFPILVDTIDDRVGAAYSGMPGRFYLIDRAGKVAFKNGRGPFGFKPAELEHSLVLLLEQEEAASGHHSRVALPDDAEAWRLLPRAEQGGGQPLPNWAKAFARSLPRTTAAMLDLDRLHRTRSPLGPVLRAKMRWVAADANRCDYSRAYAEADLRRAGVDEVEIKTLAGDHSARPESERAALKFARQMTLEADKVTDREVAFLKSAYGESKLAAMVLLLANANFQDRLLLALDVPIEPGGPRPAMEVRFARGQPYPPVPARIRPEGRPSPPVPELVDDPDWRALDIDDLRNGLDGQRSNLGRIRVPSWEEVLKGLPGDYPVPKNPSRIKWSLVCMGYQPELAIAWSACTRAFGEEAKQDRVFEESLFWVVTREIHCFY